MNRVINSITLVGKTKPIPNYSLPRVLRSQFSSAAATAPLKEEHKQEHDQESNKQHDQEDKGEWRVKRGPTRTAGIFATLAWIVAGIYLPVFNYKYQQNKSR